MRRSTWNRPVLGSARAPGSCSDEACRHGAVLFRGFPLRTAEDFDRFVAAFGLPPFTYEDSLSYAVRMNRTPRVFTANEAPPSVTDLFPSRDGPDASLSDQALLLLRAAGRRPAGRRRCAAPTSCGSGWPPSVRSLPTTSRPRACAIRTSCRRDGPGVGHGTQLAELSEDRRPAKGPKRGSASWATTWQWLADGSLKVRTPVLRGVHVLPDGRRSFFNQLIAAYCGWKDARNSTRRSRSRWATTRRSTQDAVAVAIRLVRGAGVRRSLAGRRRGPARQLRGDARPPPLHRHAEDSGGDVVGEATGTYIAGSSAL